jgi:hypothetical protein
MLNTPPQEWLSLQVGTPRDLRYSAWQRAPPSALLCNRCPQAFAAYDLKNSYDGGVSFDQVAFLKEHIPYRLGSLDLFYHALRIIVSDRPPVSARVQFDEGHELRGPSWMITNSWIETGILTCRLLIDFLEAKPSRHHDDVLIAMFKDAKGENLKSVPVDAISWFHPKGVSQHLTLDALNFTRKAADERVANLTVGEYGRQEEIQLYQIAAIAIHTATGYHLYERLELDCPGRIISDVRRSN